MVRMPKIDRKVAGNFLYVAVTDVLYYFLVGIAIYLSFAPFDNVMSKMNEVAIAAGDVGLNEGIESVLSYEETGLKIAEEVFNSAISELILIMVMLIAVVSVLAGLFKGLGYCRLRNEKFSFGYWAKASLFNILWRGGFIVLALFGTILIKPEMLSVYWLILIFVFYFFTPVILSELSPSGKFIKGIRAGFAKAFKNFLRFVLWDFALLLALIIAALFSAVFSGFIFLMLYLPLAVFLIALFKVLVFKPSSVSGPEKKEE